MVPTYCTYLVAWCLVLGTTRQRPVQRKPDVDRVRTHVWRGHELVSSSKKCGDHAVPSPRTVRSAPPRMSPMNAAQITPPPCTDASFRCRRIALCKSRIAVVNDKVPRSIEASLRFPLPDGDACICGYSLDGTEAIAVTKAKAAAVAHLEKEMGRAVATAAAVQGNFWQTSIYPLPYGEEKIVEITFFCHVGLGDAPGSLQLQIPLSFLHPLTVTMSTTVSSGAFRTITQHVGGAVDTMISGQTLVSSAIDSKLEDGIRINALIADPNISVVHAATLGGLTHFAGLVSRECLEAALTVAFGLSLIHI